MPADFLQLDGRTILVCGVSNRKSVAWHVGRVLAEAGARVIFSVRTEKRRRSVEPLVAPAAVYVCDVQQQDQIDRLRDDVARDHDRLHGLVHSIAFADYSAGRLAFHETPRAAFLQAVDISCFSLIALANALRELLDPVDGSVVTVSISTTRMTAENYGFMAPAKAALDSTVCFLAKSFSRFSSIRFNAVCPGLLKTSASAGIPGYADSYLYAEQATLRHRGLATGEVANTVAFLLSPRSAGICGQGIVVDAGMALNYFDESLVSGSSDRKPTPPS